MIYRNWFLVSLLSLISTACGSNAPNSLSNTTQLNGLTGANSAENLFNPNYAIENATIVVVNKRPAGCEPTNSGPYCGCVVAWFHTTYPGYEGEVLEIKFFSDEQGSPEECDLIDIFEDMSTQKCYWVSE